MNLAILGKRIKCQREKARLTQAQLANSLQITAQAVSKWERGENAPDIAILKMLSAVLDVSVDWLLSGQDTRPDTFETSIFCTSMRNFAKRSAHTAPKDIALWINGLFTVLTECTLRNGGVPVKYVGDGFLAYFSESRHQLRALQAARDGCAAIQDPNLLITLHSGPIYLGAIGHHDFARPDIMGDAVNTVFLMNQWATTHSQARLLLSAEMFNHLQKQQELSASAVSFQPRSDTESLPLYELS
jgi:class 3 adenylate cyclase